MPFKIPEAVRTRAEMTQKIDTIVRPKGSVGRIRTQRQSTTCITARPKRNSRKKIDYSWNDRGQTPKSQCRGHAVRAEREKPRYIHSSSNTPSLDLIPNNPNRLLPISTARPPQSSDDILPHTGCVLIHTVCTLPYIRCIPLRTQCGSFAAVPLVCGIFSLDTLCRFWLFDFVLVHILLAFLHECTCRRASSTVGYDSVLLEFVGSDFRGRHPLHSPQGSLGYPFNQPLILHGRWREVFGFCQALACFLAQHLDISISFLYLLWNSQFSLFSYGFGDGLDDIFESLLKLSLTASSNGLQSVFNLFRFGTKYSAARGGAAAAFLDIFDGVGVEIIVVREFLSCHDTPIPGEKRHAWFAGYSPFNHFAIGFAGMIDEASYRSSGSVQNHVLVEVHEIVALYMISVYGKIANITHLSILVSFVHSIITLILRYYLACILHDNLVGFECTIASHSVSTIDSLDNLDANVILAPCFSSFSQSSEGTVRAVLIANITITVITLVKHKTIKTILVTAALRRTYTCRCLERFRFLPNRGGITNKDIWSYG